MKSLRQNGNDYLQTLKTRAKESHVHRKFQLVGLEIADLLHDRAHKTLYIKLAKERGADRLLAIAKDISERKDVKNRGAYFMRVIAKNANVRGTHANEK